jgi:DNA sulfur modification protein DndD
MRLIEQRAAHEAEIARLAGHVTELRRKKRGLEEDVKKYERLMTLFNERERINKEIAEIDRKQAEKESRLKEAMAGAWRGVLAPKLTQALSDLEGQRDALQAAGSRKAAAAYLISMIDGGLRVGCCPACDTGITDSSQAALSRLKTQLEAESQQQGSQAELDELLRKISILREVSGAFSAQLARELADDIEDCLMERHVKTHRLSEIEEATRALDESEHRRIQASYDNTIKEITLIEQGIQKEREALNRVEQDIEKVQRKLDQLGGADLAHDRHRREVATGLYDLLNEAVDVYRDKLRRKVEADASSLFLKLTTEPEYSGLQINESYGLSILHKDGAVIPVRSAGAEHIVALSLMGALQKNAPLQGPIIMDSPFGRLDDQHTTKVVESLPDMATQVMLLVYESELEPRIARERLQGNLKREYRIGRMTARHSIIEERHD